MTDMLTNQRADAETKLPELGSVWKYDDQTLSNQEGIAFGEVLETVPVGQHHAGMVVVAWYTHLNHAYPDSAEMSARFKSIMSLPEFNELIASGKLKDAHEGYRKRLSREERKAVNDDVLSRQPKTRNMPDLRFRIAYDAAIKVGEQLGLQDGEAGIVAMAVIAVIEHNTKRVFICQRCGKPCDYDNLEEIKDCSRHTKFGEDDLFMLMGHLYWPELGTTGAVASK